MGFPSVPLLSAHHHRGVSLATGIPVGRPMSDRTPARGTFAQPTRMHSAAGYPAPPPYATTNLGAGIDSNGRTRPLQDADPDSPPGSAPLAAMGGEGTHSPRAMPVPEPTQQHLPGKPGGDERTGRGQFLAQQHAFNHAGLALYRGDSQEEHDMAFIRGPDYPARLRTILSEQTQDKKYAWTIDQFEWWMPDWKNLQPSTRTSRLATLARLAGHPVHPVVLQGMAAEIVTSFYHHYRHRRDVEGKSPAALSNDFKAIRLLGAFLGIPDNAWPTQPPVPRKAKKMLPSPEEVYDLLHDQYTPDARNSYENALIRYLLAVDFGLGLRYPNEAWSLRVQDVDLDSHTVVVTENKKRGSTRRLLIEPTWLCCNHTTLSLRNWLDWRSKVDVGGTDALFLKPDGQPFRSANYLRVWLAQRVQPKYPWFTGYTGRRWCANARLIDSGFDHARVADWLGHEGVDMLRRHYEQDARLHEKMHGKDWISRAFRRPRSTGTEDQPPKNGLSSGSNRSGVQRTQGGKSAAPGGAADDQTPDSCSSSVSSPSSSSLRRRVGRRERLAATDRARRDLRRILNEPRSRCYAAPGARP